MAVIRGHRDAKGITAADLDPIGAETNVLLNRVIKKLDGLGPQKASADEADYTEDGPFPFVCETCRYLDRSTSECSKVEGPGRGGTVELEDTCRWWEPAPTMAGRMMRRRPDGD